MSLRVLLVLAVCFIAIPFAVFLRPANADTVPQAIVVTHCGKEVMFIGINKGRFNVATPEAITANDDLTRFFLEILRAGSVTVFKVEEQSGVKCPVHA